MRLTLIRHTAVAVEPGLCYGRTDVPLADTFDAEAARLCARLPAFDRVWTSPAARCRTLAERLSTRTGEAAVVDARLQELDFGAWESRRWDDIGGAGARAWGDNFVRCPCPGGESYLQLADRVAAWADELTRGHVAAVTHGGPVRALLARLLVLPLERSFAFAVDPGSATVLCRAEGSWRAEVVNLRLAAAELLFPET